MDRRASNATDFPAKSTRAQSIISLGQPSLSFYSEDDDALLDLASKLQTDGTKVHYNHIVYLETAVILLLL